MTDEWVTVAVFQQPAPAALARSALEAAGIECWLRDENIVSTYGIAATAFGGIKLQVRPEDVDAARQILYRPVIVE
jgi:hypothetical protein